MGNRQINYVTVYEFLRHQLGDKPAVLPGTPAWQLLPDDHPDKWRAVLWAAIWWCLSEDTRQEAMAESSREISSAAPWSALAQRVAQGRSSAYIERRKAAS
ncbi:DUF2742 domain-containing protein [[Mycobacterium] burgundiense]|uniref:DUF2742 domain-containing protein n=1 Tax=[Mycobacterium] burgundiense TaxID=3064286 RepID=A0ABM9L9E7_9MYCO|nr:DUF2742 domain-containing protein [Mycolicibacterium sp. MU0053]CAJ1495117.1 DUF2742 domain-containing protein [Mycolicibacterium sp. MU0053]